MCISIPRLRLQGFAKIGSSVFIPVRVGRGDAAPVNVSEVDRVRGRERRRLRRRVSGAAHVASRATRPWWFTVSRNLVAALDWVFFVQVAGRVAP